MKPTKQFKVVYNPDIRMNNFMRVCDLMREGEGIYTEKIFTVTWREGEKVTKARIAQTAANIKKAIELAGGEVRSITEVLPERKLI